MAEGKDNKNEFILSWLRDTEDAEKPCDDVPDEPIFKCEDKPGFEPVSLLFNLNYLSSQVLIRVTLVKA